ncbi:MAG: hypothetical protein LCH51_02125 [Bacteroidetes bacterium]|nr:hypothetical protein [Bacteroidota bacterium]
MNRITRSFTLIAVLALSFVCAYAGNKAPQPKFHFNAAISLDSLGTAEEATEEATLAASSSKKVCACQILVLESKNYQQKQVMILAEKTNNGDTKATYSAARKRIEKEKRYLATVFYDKVSKTAEANGSTDCKKLYLKMKLADSSLKVYDILDADYKP